MGVAVAGRLREEDDRRRGHNPAKMTSTAYSSVFQSRSKEHGRLHLHTVLVCMTCPTTTALTEAREIKIEEKVWEISNVCFM